MIVLIILVSWGPIRIRDFSMMNTLLLPSSRATTTLRTSRILLLLIHSDVPYSASTNLVQLLQVWTSSSSSSSSLQGPFATKAFSIMKYAPPLFLLSRDNDLDNVPCFASFWFPYSVRIWSSFLNYESLHLPSACLFSSPESHGDNDSVDTRQAMWAICFAS